MEPINFEKLRTEIAQRAVTIIDSQPGVDYITACPDRFLKHLPFPYKYINKGKFRMVYEIPCGLVLKITSDNKQNAKEWDAMQAYPELFPRGYAFSTHAMVVEKAELITEEDPRLFAPGFQERLTKLREVHQELKSKDLGFVNDKLVLIGTWRGYGYGQSK
jgi:hypothetical protein